MSNEDKIRNKKDEVVGKIKETVGRVVGNEELEEKGKAEQAEAHLKQTGERIKDAAKDVVEDDE